METIFRVKKGSFFGVNIFILDAIAESNIIFRGLTLSRIQRRLLICLHTSQFTRNALQYNGKVSVCYARGIFPGKLPGKEDCEGSGQERRNTSNSHSSFRMEDTLLARSFCQSTGL
jgi:hypothetical protein